MSSLSHIRVARVSGRARVRHVLSAVFSVTISANLNLAQAERMGLGVNGNSCPKDFSRFASSISSLLQLADPGQWLFAQTPCPPSLVTSPHHISSLQATLDPSTSQLLTHLFPERRPACLESFRHLRTHRAALNFPPPPRRKSLCIDA